MTQTRPNTVAGLREMHAAIAGQIEAKRTELARLVADLEAVEHTLRLFDPDAQLPKAKPLPNPHAAFKGEMRGTCSRLSARLRGRSRRWISPVR